MANVHACGITNRKARNKQYRKTMQMGEKRTLVFESKTCVDCENVNEMKTCKSAVKEEFGLKWRNVPLATCHSDAYRTQRGLNTYSIEYIKLICDSSA